MSVNALFAFISRVSQTFSCYMSIKVNFQRKKTKFYSQNNFSLLFIYAKTLQTSITNKQNYSLIVVQIQQPQRTYQSMTEETRQKQLHSVNYLNELMEKNLKASSRALQYVTLKNVQISQRLVNGEEIISQEQAQIKILKNQPQNDRKKIKEIQNTLEKQVIEKKILVISGQSKQQEQKTPIKNLTEQQRLKFVKQKIRENKRLQKRKQEQAKMLQEKQKIQKQLQQEQKLKKQQEIRKQRIQSTKLKLQEIQKRKQQRVLQNKKTNQILKEKSKQKILADKIHEKYLSNQNLLLDQKKKRLAEIRQFYKPIDKKQLDEHMKKIQQAKLQHSRKKQTNKSQANPSSQKLNQYYRSIFHQILQKEKKAKEQDEIEQNYKIKELKQKGKKYAEQIKANFKPEIDPKKKQQIQKRIKSSSLAGSKVDMKLKGMEYLEFAKQYANKFKKQVQAQPENQVLMRKQANKTQHIDYLEEFRKKNDDSRLKRSVTSAQDFIKKVEKKNISVRQKQESIIQFAEDLQRKARAKEQMTKGTFGEGIDQEVDKLYISAIEAKIKALQV